MASETRAGFVVNQPETPQMKEEAYVTPQMGNPVAQKLIMDQMAGSTSKTLDLKRTPLKQIRKIMAGEMESEGIVAMTATLV